MSSVPGLPDRGGEGGLPVAPSYDGLMAALRDFQAMLPLEAVPDSVAIESALKAAYAIDTARGPVEGAPRRLKGADGNLYLVADGETWMLKAHAQGQNPEALHLTREEAEAVLLCARGAKTPTSIPPELERIAAFVEASNPNRTHRNEVLGRVDAALSPDREDTDA